MAHLRRPSVLPAVAVLAVALSMFAPAGSGAPAKAPPFKRGTTWTYRYAVVNPDGDTRTGTITEVYGGQTTYRGRTYEYVDTSTTLQPGLVERIFVEWTGTHFRQIANVATDAQQNTVEIIFDKAFASSIEENLSGTALIFHNGVQKATPPWSFVSWARGTVKVTVPAGTYQTTRWDAVLRVGELETHLSSYTVGQKDVRRDSKLYISGTLHNTRYRELISGPVR